MDEGVAPLGSGPPEPLAVIGLAGHFAGDATDTAKLWQMLLEQRAAAGPVPASRFDVASYYHPDSEHGGTVATESGYFLRNNIDALDTSLFNLTANEVASMDPQQKMLLGSVFHALENGTSMPPLKQIVTRRDIHSFSSVNP
jgi:acyl transferase domain-containing protein